MAKHLSLDDRSAIRNGLDCSHSFKQIGRKLGKDCTTISKEVKNHLVFRKTGAVGRAVSAGPAKTVTMYARISKKNIVPDCLSRLMCATDVLTKTNAPCRNVSTTRFLLIMSIKLFCLKRGKASLFPKGISGTWTNWSLHLFSKGSLSITSL